jgi:hypothetical protein
MLTERWICRPDGVQRTLTVPNHRPRLLWTRCNFARAELYRVDVPAATQLTSQGLPASWHAALAPDGQRPPDYVRTLQRSPERVRASRCVARPPAIAILLQRHVLD